MYIHKLFSTWCSYRYVYFVVVSTTLARDSARLTIVPVLPWYVAPHLQGAPTNCQFFTTLFLVCEHWENVHKPQMLSKVSVHELCIIFKTCCLLPGASSHATTGALPLDPAGGLPQIRGVGELLSPNPPICPLLERSWTLPKKPSDIAPKRPMTAWWRGAPCPACKNLEPLSTLLVLLNSQCPTRWGSWAPRVALIWGSLNG